MTTKQELIDFINNFDKDYISKDDVLKFIEESNYTKITIDRFSYDINNSGYRRIYHDYHSLIDLLSGYEYQNKVIVEFESLNKAYSHAVISILNFFISKGYKLNGTMIDGISFVKGN